MPKSCAARQCCNRYSSRRKQLTFHRFPFSRPELLKAWVLNIGRADFQPKQHTVICSEHFRPDCFSAFGNRKNLKHNAVPTVFAFQDTEQLARENPDPVDEREDAASQKEVCLETGAEGNGPGRNMDTARERQQPPHMDGNAHQGSAHRAEATEAPGRPASPVGRRRPLPGQPSDHSYALLDLDALKSKLFLTLRENEKLRRRLRTQRLLLRRLHPGLWLRGGRRALRARAPAPQRS